MNWKIAILFFVLCFGLEAQPPTRFYAKYGGAGEDVAYSGKVTLDKQYIIAGSSTSRNLFDTDMILLKLDQNGNGKWLKYFGSSQNEFAKSVLVLPDSSFILIGSTSTLNQGYDVLIVKVDKAGNELWTRTWGGNDWDFGEDAVLGPGGNLFIVGHTASYGLGKEDGFLLKYDTVGTFISVRYYGGVEDDRLVSIVNSQDGNLAMVGQTASRGEKNGDGLILKVNANGDTVFVKTFGGPYLDYAADIVERQNAEFFVCGAKTYGMNESTHSYMYRIGSTGSFLIDTNYYRNAGDEYFSSVANSTMSGSLTAFVRSIVKPGLSMQAEIFVGYPGGNHYIVNDSGHGAEEYVNSVEATDDGGYICVGSTNGFNSKNTDIYFIKHDSTIINYSSIVEIQDLRETDKKIYVNGNYLHFSEVFSFHRVEVFSVFGQLVYEQEIAAGESKVDIPVLEDSILLIKLWDNLGRYQCLKIVNTQRSF